MSRGLEGRADAGRARPQRDREAAFREPPAKASARPAARRRGEPKKEGQPGEVRRRAKARTAREGKEQRLSPVEGGRRCEVVRLHHEAAHRPRPRSLAAVRPGEAGPRGREREGDARAEKTASRVWVRTALTALLLASLVLMLWVYMYTGVLNVKAVEVRGNHRLDAAYLRALSGITSQTHLLRMDVGAVERAILSEPYVAEVKVSRRFPYTVILQVREKEPLGVIVQNGKYHLVDAEGMVLESRDAPGEGLVEIRCSEPRLLYPGVILEDANFPGYAALLRDMPQGLREVTVATGFQEGEGFFLESAGTRIIIGSIEEVSRKLEIAFFALQELVPRHGKLAYVDVTYPDYPAIKPAE